MPRVATGKTILIGSITHTRDGESIFFDGILLRFAALDCTKKGTAKYGYATKSTKKFYGLKATCELKSAKMCEVGND